MLYTIGNPESYEEYLDKWDEPKKLGKTILDNGKPYEGGIAFLTKIDAERYVKRYYPTYKVYGLDCDISNTYVRRGKRHIIENTLLLRVD
ncbi:MAG: hypothetical protein WC284_12985 [Candidimonas sp.]